MPAVVSVLVPTYNGQRFIAPTIESVLAQTYEHLEVVVGDDCSSDGTVEIVRHLTAGDPRVRVLEYDRNVGGFARHDGVLVVKDPPRAAGRASHDVLLRASTGPYVKFLLQDDLLAPDAIERLVAPL